MASVQYLFSFTNSYKKELVSTQLILDDVTKSRSLNAVVIQKTWRGYSTRKKYLWTRKAIITIQSYYRGWDVRRRRQEFIRMHEQDMHDLFLHKMATRIQAAWRGYIVRKYMRDRLPKKLIENRKRMLAANAKMQEEFRELFRLNRLKNEEEEEEKYKNMVLFILFKCHHLLRTYQKEGIYSIHNSKDLSLIEKLMKLLPLKEYVEELRKVYEEGMRNKTNTPNYLFADKKLRKFEDLIRLRDRSRDVKPVEIPDPPFYNKRFNFSWRLEDKPYEREMLRTEDYCPPVVCAEHNVEDKAKNYSETDFMLFDKLDALEDKNLPYYIDFWEKNICKIHNPEPCD